MKRVRTHVVGENKTAASAAPSSRTAMPSCDDHSRLTDLSPAIGNQATSRLMAEQHRGVKRSTDTTIRRYYYLWNTDIDLDEAIKYDDKDNPANSSVLRPDTGTNFFRPDKAKHLYINSQSSEPKRGAYASELIDENEKVIAIAQRIIDQMELLANEPGADQKSHMMGVLINRLGAIEVSASGGKHPRQTFRDAVQQLNELEAEATKEGAEVLRESQKPVAVDGKHHYTGGSGNKVMCAAPKLLDTVKNDVAAVVAMTEVFFDPLGDGVTVDGIRYHHRQRVPSCEKCVTNLWQLTRKAAIESLKVCMATANVNAGSFLTDPEFELQDARYKRAEMVRDFLLAEREKLVEKNNKSFITRYGENGINASLKGAWARYEKLQTELGGLAQDADDMRSDRSTDDYDWNSDLEFLLVKAGMRFQSTEMDLKQAQADLQADTQPATRLKGAVVAGVAELLELVQPHADNKFLDERINLYAET